MELLKRNPALTSIFLGALVIIGYLHYQVRTLEKTYETKTVANCVPTFRDGGGPYYKPNSPFRQQIAPDKSRGETLIMKGRILRNDCKTPIKKAVLDIWQANESGSYEDAWYRGQVRTNSKGEYTFETVIPKGYGEGTGYRPPHIHFKVHIDEKEVITSQMFFPEIKGQAGFDDAYIMKIESSKENGDKINHGYHDIILP